MRLTAEADLLGIIEHRYRLGRTRGTRRKPVHVGQEAVLLSKNLVFTGGTGAEPLTPVDS
jgi:hypothetical protein